MCKIEDPAQAVTLWSKHLWAAANRRGPDLAPLIDSKEKGTKTIPRTNPRENVTMSEFKQYRKVGTQTMRPYIPGEVLGPNVSVSTIDTLEAGGMIAVSPNNPDDQWYVAKNFFEKNYELATEA